MGDEGEVNILSSHGEIECDVGDVVCRGLREDAFKPSASCVRLGGVFSPYFELVVAADGGQELA